MTERGDAELQQLTERLTLSRTRPKRQWLIERIGHLWSNPRRRSIFNSFAASLESAAPTPESLDTVRSFSSDPELNVRVAVAFALRQFTVPDAYAVSALTDLLSDAHPIVRSNAAHGLALPGRPELMTEHSVDTALASETWTVRWVIAASLYKSRFADRAWATLRESVPTTDFYLSEWMQYCTPYRDRILDDTEIRHRMTERFKRMAPGDHMLQHTCDILTRLIAPHKLG